MHRLMLGTKGMGKSHLARALLIRSRKRAIVDPRKEHQSKLHQAVECTSVDDFIDFYATDPEAHNRIGICVPMEDDETEYARLFRFLSKMTGFTIFIDEIDQFCSTKHLPRNVGKLVNFQRHWKVDLIFAARRPAAIHRDITSLADEIYFFHMHEGRDLLYVKDLCGGVFADRVKALKQREYMMKPFPDVR